MQKTVAWITLIGVLFLALTNFAHTRALISRREQIDSQSSIIDAQSNTIHILSEKNELLNRKVQNLEAPEKIRLLNQKVKSLQEAVRTKRNQTVVLPEVY